MLDDYGALYRGDGSGKTGVLPPYQSLTRFDSPEGYLADDGLRDAVNVALLLGQPLLVTGEPGTGKSLLAYSVAHEMQAGVPDERGRLGPLVFHCKTTSTANDLFYRYDALRRFHDANRKEGALPPEHTYVTCEALGLAILLANPVDAVADYLPPRLHGIGPKRCVVLADEIDKAPRDLPNDILNEIERMTFTVRETRPSRTFTADDAFKPILILTSNSERDLPDAFLRRCVFYHVPFPSRERMQEILARRLTPANSDVVTPLDSAYYAKIVECFEEIRKLSSLRKKPATAELIAWARLLVSQGIAVEEIPGKTEQQRQSAVALLAKTEHDRRLLMDWFLSRK